MIGRVVAALLLALALLVSPTAAAPNAPGTWCSALDAGSPTIDAMGDSLTDGASVPSAFRWTTELSESLRSGGAPGTQVWTGAAIPGSATADYLPGAKYSSHVEFTVNHPDLILMGWGTNDWWGGVPPEVFQAQYQQIIDRVRVLSPGSMLVLEHMPWVYNTALTSTHGDQTAYQQAIRALAAANGALFVDYAWYFPGNDPNGQYTSDKVHHTAVGQLVVYTAIRSVITTTCGWSG